jgi:hypothetical protein
MKIVQLFIVVLLLSFGACSSSTPQPKNPNDMPAWVITPSMDGYRGSVGVAGRTYDQSVSTQRKLAIKRALDELSLQTKVRLKLHMTKEETATKSKSTVRTTDQSIYSTNASITAHIQDAWIDRSSQELYIWMVLDK